LQLALEGKVEEHHRFLLSVQLHRLWAVEKDLAIVQQRIQEKRKSYAAEVTLLDEIPGVDAALAGAVIAELGADMRVFENASQLASWAGVCPGNNESAGKRRNSRIPKGNVYLKTALVEAPTRRQKPKALTEGQILPTQSSARLQARRCSGSPQDLSGYLPHPFPPSLLQRIGGSLPRQAQQTPPYSQLGSSPGASRVHRDTAPESGVTPNPSAR
jgi:hypothetical protein